jgi:hypothetical protein
VVVRIRDTPKEKEKSLTIAFFINSSLVQLYIFIAESDNSFLSHARTFLNGKSEKEDGFLLSSLSSPTHPAFLSLFLFLSFALSLSFFLLYFPSPFPVQMSLSQSAEGTDRHSGAPFTNLSKFLLSFFYLFFQLQILARFY